MRLNRNIFVFLLCLIISAFLWFFTTINKEYTAFINLAVHFKNVPEQFNIGNNNESSFKLQVDGHGYDLFKNRLKNHNNSKFIDFNDQRLQNAVREDIRKHTTYILSNDIKSIFSDLVDDNIHINSILPDTVYINFTSIND